MEILPAGLPDLSKPSRTLLKLRETKLFSIKMFEKVFRILRVFAVEHKNFLETCTKNLRIAEDTVQAARLVLAGQPSNLDARNNGKIIIPASTPKQEET